MTRTVLFLCTGNSCRSQMAEALVNHYLGGQWRAVSAGTDPAGFVHPLALRVLEELWVPTDGLHSKVAAAFREADLALVITVCDDAAERCPVWLGPGRRRHLSFPDPARAEGAEEERLAVFRQVRDDIRARVLGALREEQEGAEPASGAPA